MSNVNEKAEKFSAIKFKKLMEERGYSQRFLAEKTGVCQANISYYLNEKTIPSKKTVQVFAREFCVEYEDLMNDPELIEKKKEGAYDDILEIAKQLGNIRFDLIQKLQELNNTETNYNGLDQDFLHKIENIADLTKEEAYEIILNEQKSRKNRRNAKVRKYLIKLLLDGFLIKAPVTYMNKIIENSQNWQYIPKVMDELKKDNSLYDLKKENALKEKYAKSKENK